MRPGDDETPHAGDRQQVDEAEPARHPAAERADAGQPQRRARPERVAGDEVADVRADEPDQRGHREVDEHRVQRVPRDRGAAEDRFGLHRRILTIAAAVALAGCEGPLSILDPAGPSARDRQRLVVDVRRRGGGLRRHRRGLDAADAPPRRARRPGRRRTRHRPRRCARAAGRPPPGWSAAASCCRRWRCSRCWSSDRRPRCTSCRCPAPARRRCGVPRSAASGAGNCTTPTPA
ncbi:MAG: hypothetical protein MZW92_20770 [Comamonadaceae bacterium]|nr:hypothetical protein [Comamonadaceae bacterium]